MHIGRYLHAAFVLVILYYVQNPKMAAFVNTYKGTCLENEK